MRNIYPYFVICPSALHRLCTFSLRSFLRTVGSVVLACCAFFSPIVLAEDTTPSAIPNPPVNESLQQQLQTLQDSIQASSKEVQKKPGTAKTRIESSQTSSVTKEVQKTPDTTKTTTESSLVTSEKKDIAVVPGAPVRIEEPQVNNNGEAATAPAAAATAPEGGEGIEGDDMRSQAFGKMLTTTLPLSPSQIRMLRNMYDATQQAAAAYPGVPPRPTASSLVVNLSPGATPPVVRLGAGFITSLVFVDSTGAPWPIDSYSLGNPTAFNIQWDKKSNILLVQAITGHRMGNLAVILKGLNTPVMLNLSPGQAALDVRVDLRIPGLGPEAKPTLDVLPGTESPALLALLDGIPPPGAKRLKSSACENCAWMVDRTLYLRTQFSVLSPAWISTLSSADGTHVYEMQLTPLVLATYNGKTIKMRIEGF